MADQEFLNIRMLKFEKIKMAVWIMNRLIDTNPLLYVNLKDAYIKEFYK